MKSYKIILASASPRRRELLSTVVSAFSVVPTDAEECEYEKRPSRLTIENAVAKARAISDDEAVIIAADTVVFYKGRYFLKPRSKEDAVSMLKTLSGRTHTVYTGVCVRQGDKIITFYDKSAVKFKAVDEKTIRDYVDTGSPMDKAGAYGIQDNVIVRSYTGSYSNIMGLPLEKLSEVLKAFCL